MPSVPGKMGNHSSERAAVLESRTSKVTSFVLFSANPSAILWEYGLWKYAASRILLPKLRIYFVLAKSGVSMSGPHVGSIPIFLLDSHMDVWFTPVLVPNGFINLPHAGIPFCAKPPSRRDMFWIPFKLHNPVIFYECQPAVFNIANQAGIGNRLTLCKGFW